MASRLDLDRSVRPVREDNSEGLRIQKTAREAEAEQSRESAHVEDSRIIRKGVAGRREDGGGLL